MTLREMQLAELNENLRARFPQRQVRPVKETDSRRHQRSAVRLLEASLRTGDVRLDNEGNLIFGEAAEAARITDDTEAARQSEERALKEAMRPYLELGMNEAGARAAAIGRPERRF